MNKLFLSLLTGLILTGLLSCGSEEAKFKVLGSPTISISEAVTHYGSPTYEQVKLYTFWVSENPDCTSLVQLEDYGADGQSFDMFSNPTLFSGNPPDGTYNCIVIKLSDNMNFKPAQSDGTGICVAGTTYTYDIARGDGEETWVDQNFVPITIDGNENTVYFFASTDIAAAEAKGVSPYQITELLSPLVSPGQVTMALDFTDMVFITEVAGVQKCWLDMPTMAFE